MAVNCAYTVVQFVGLFNIKKKNNPIVPYIWKYATPF